MQAAPLEHNAPQVESTTFRILITISLCHFLNDTTQSLLVPTYPLLKDAFALTFTQIGLITLAYQLTASLLQPLVGYFADRRPMPYSLPVGMAFTLSGLVMMAYASTYGWLLSGAMLLGTGSSVFHPESSRMARMASGGRFGLAQSIFQVGGNAGSSCGPLLAAAIIIPHGQKSLAWFAFLPLMAIILLLSVSGWARQRIRSAGTKHVVTRATPVSRGVIIRTTAILLVLIFSKYFYTASISSYFIFYLTDKFGITVQAAQTRLFVFLAAMAMGTLLGGPIGDRIGRKYVIWVSILGVAPFTLALPHLGLFWTGIFVFIIGFVLSSAFSAIVVFAQELVPGRVGLIAGFFFGFSFGMGGIGAAVFGKVADLYGVGYVYTLCAYLPLLGLTAVFLPNLKEERIKS
ncbi:MAG: MFS transporter [Planctomycetes bacterium]|nr:MFS transporter [Planctomycetota bacterium]